VTSVPPPVPKITVGINGSDEKVVILERDETGKLVRTTTGHSTIVSPNAVSTGFTTPTASTFTVNTEALEKGLRGMRTYMCIVLLCAALAIILLAVIALQSAHNADSGPAPIDPDTWVAGQSLARVPFVIGILVGKFYMACC
jgi:hypothetical protein